MTFGDRLRLLRQEKEIRQEDLAETIKVHRATIGKYETNERFPDRDTLIKIADYFGVSIDYLLGYSDIRKPSKTDDLFEQIGVVIRRDPKPLSQKDKEKLLRIIDTAWPVEDDK